MQHNIEQKEKKENSDNDIIEYLIRAIRHHLKKLHLHCKAISSQMGALRPSLGCC